MPVKLSKAEVEDLVFSQESLKGMPPVTDLVGQGALGYPLPEDGHFDTPSNPDGHVIQGLDIALDLIDKADKPKVLVYFDPDVDGLFAGKMLVDLLADKGIKPKTYINPNRSHGFNLDLVPKLRGWTVLNGDFTISESEIKQMVQGGVNVVSLDHHDNGDHLIHYKHKGHEGVVINNMFDGEPESDHFLSGAGVVYKLLEYFNPEKYNTVEYRAMVGITLLSDVRDIEAPNAIHFMEPMFGYNSSGYLREMSLAAERNRINLFRYPAFTREFVNFTFNPQLNAMLRLGYEKDVVRYILNQPGWEGINAPAAQTKQRKLVTSMSRKAVVRDLPGCVAVILKVEDLDEEEQRLYTHFIGLLCSRFSDTYNKPAVGFCIEGKKVVRGSFRGQVSGYDYRGLISKRCPEGVEVRGHGIAFGIVGLTVDKLNAFCTVVNSVCKKQPEDPARYPLVLECSSLQDVMEDESLARVGVHNAYRLFAKKIGLRLISPRTRTITEGSKYGEYSFDGKFNVKTFCGATPEDGIFIPYLCGTELTWELVNDAK